MDSLDAEPKIICSPATRWNGLGESKLDEPFVSRKSYYLVLRRANIYDTAGEDNSNEEAVCSNRVESRIVNREASDNLHGTPLTPLFRT